MTPLQLLQAERDKVKLAEREAWDLLQAKKQEYDDEAKKWNAFYDDVKRLDKEIAIEEGIQARLEGAV